MSTFEEALMLSNERWLNTLPAEIPPHTFSPAHEKRMKKLFDKMRGDRYHRLSKRALIALIAAILLLIAMTVSVFAVPSMRQYFLTSDKLGSTYYAHSDKSYELPEKLHADYVPAGYTLVAEEHTVMENHLEYSNEDGSKWYNVFQKTIDAEYGFDTESYPYEIVTLKNQDYIYYHSDTTGGCIWNDGRYVYAVSGTLSKDELFKIIESIY